MKASVALVFVATNERDLLAGALQSLRDNPPARKLEIVVVDNSSSDGTAEAISKKWTDVEVFKRDTAVGLPANLNYGIKATTAPFVMLCNCDLIFRRGSVDKLTDFLDSHPRVGLAAPRLLSPDGATRPSARRWYTASSLIALKGPWKNLTSNFPSVKKSVYDDWDYGDARLVDWVPCPATMIRRAALDEVGLLDERFRLYFDDVDISMRMHEAGWEVWCVPQAEVVHLEQRSSIRAFSKAWRWHLGSLLKFLWKHRRLSPKHRATDGPL